MLPKEEIMPAPLMIPGAREPNTLTRRQSGSMGPALDADAPEPGGSLLDAATIIERRREGGGGRWTRQPAPGQDAK
jgi:hypothetical protein